MTSFLLKGREDVEAQHKAGHGRTSLFHWLHSDSRTRDAKCSASSRDYLARSISGPWSAHCVANGNGAAADRQPRHFPLTLRLSLEWDSFGGRVGGPARLELGRPLLGEAGEARGPHGGDDGANDRGRQVQPRIVEI